MIGYNLPVDKALYIVGRTDQIKGTYDKMGYKKSCLWTGPKHDHNEFYPSNVLICHSHNIPLERILPHGVTHFRTENLVLLIRVGAEEVVVFNAAEFALNITFVKAILGTLSFTCSSSLFVIIEGDDGEMPKCKLTIKGKTPKSIHDIAQVLFAHIVKL